jgi:serine kinase of HPr protein (carbohydrate metabolism regulator)
MTGTSETSVHASAVLVGKRAVLIRGPSGAGKSRLAFDLILAGRSGQIALAVLVGDDRVHLWAADGQLMVRPAPQLSGLIEVRGLGIRGCPFVPQASLGLVVDLGAPDAERLPSSDKLKTRIQGVELSRIPVETGFSALPLVVAFLTTTRGTDYSELSTDCAKGIGNHMRPSIATE